MYWPIFFNYNRYKLIWICRQLPTDDERLALASYFHLSARLYPCGECASEFQSLLKKYPPQVRSFHSCGIGFPDIERGFRRHPAKQRLSGCVICTTKSMSDLANLSLIVPTWTALMIVDAVTSPWIRQLNPLLIR